MITTRLHGARVGEARNRALALGVGLALVLLAALACASPALAAVRWQLSSRAAPTNLPPGGAGLIVVAADPLGDAGVSGASSRIAITDTLPVGLRVSDPAKVVPHWARARESPEERAENWECSVAEARVVTCSTSHEVPPYERLEMEIPVTVEEPAGATLSLPNQLSVQGGQAVGGAAPAPASLTRAVQVSGEPVSYGIEPGGYAIALENEDGSTDTQAGSHPYQLQSTVDFNQTLEEVQLPGQPVRLEAGAPGLTKNVSFNLPPGLLGNLAAVGQCSASDFSSLTTSVGGARNLCPAGSAIGVATVTILAPSPLGYATVAVPLFNLEPAQGEPGRFGFEVEGVPVVVDVAVRTDGDYGVTATVNNATAAAQVLGAEVIFWGEPGDQSHDGSRGWQCLREGVFSKGEPCQAPSPRPSVPFLTLPTACTGQLQTTMEGVDWTGALAQGSYLFGNQLGEPLASLTGCDRLVLDPALEVSPREGQGEPTTSASTPTGLDVKVKVSQAGTLTAGALGDAAVRSATVTLPEGVMLSPSAANGLQACSEQQIGYQGEGAQDPFAPGALEPLRFSSDPAHCPEASKLGTVRVKTPLLAEELTGNVYLAAQEANPFGSLIALYIVAENQKLGLRVKLAGQGSLNEVTGQVSTSFAETPQVPFEELEVKLFGGPRGSLSTPSACGSYAATASFEPWSTGVPVPASSDPAAFTISSGAGGGPCPSSPLPFTPSFQAGSVELQAGAFTSFTLDVAHPDSDQPLGAITMHLPAGVAAMLSSVTPCPDAQAAQNQCGPESLIGHSLASAGLGPEPVSLPGSVYLTGPYKGAPFGLSVVTPAVAGPFDLGDVTVRSKIEVDPFTAAVTIASDPFPTFVRGVPAQLKQIHVTVDRPGFQFNPTSCAPKAISGTLSGAQGASVAVSSPFQAAGCEHLPFSPALSATAGGQGSKANGTSFKVTVTSQGLGQANIAKVDLALPKQLPSRLTTLQKACLAATFEADPASCSPESVIGTAIIHTPVLKSPLQGPAYLVSHGNAAFPDVEFVLQGEGVKLVLDGKTDIKNGITYSRFEATPDAPFTTFETILPAGPHSVLTTNVPASANYNLCAQKLQMPTEITAQNGAKITTTTNVGISGCGQVKGAKAKKLTRAQLLKRCQAKAGKRYKHSKRKRAKALAQCKRRYGRRQKAKKDRVARQLQHVARR
ncbi:MAG TPA: hypothetical protein VL988_01635 [Solirubrobacteraceae bacterium]|nr:hypothetical protein [Solirubrobacteraceae bacterium]